MFLNGSVRFSTVIVVIGLLFVLFGPAPSGPLVVVVAAVTIAMVVFVELFAGPEKAPAEALEKAGQ